jgi:site-specific DNA-methyltransferase (adenine-specific)
MSNNLILGDCIEKLKDIPSNSVDAVITDPPYKYLKHKLETDWNEEAFFNECYRVIKDTGFLIFFGRGISFYRWNVLCDKIGFNFKEELVWEKQNITCPYNPIGRLHELVNIFGRKDTVLNKIKINKLEQKKLRNPEGLIDDMKRICQAINKAEKLEDFLEIRNGGLKKRHSSKHIIGGSNLKDVSRGYSFYKMVIQGGIFPSIIKVSREHYTAEHPTQKPAALMALLIKLVSKEGDMILDPFMGGGSTGVACMRENRNFIGIELLPEYYEIAQRRISNALNPDYKPPAFDYQRGEISRESPQETKKEVTLFDIA